MLATTMEGLVVKRHLLLEVKLRIPSGEGGENGKANMTKACKT
jgi:hypothetical protein